MKNKSFGWVCMAVFMVSIPFANWWLHHFGLAMVPGFGKIPSAVWVVGIAFVVRDLAQLSLGRPLAWAAILVGTALSYWFAGAALALASGAAFLWSEGTDALIFTPLANRGRFLLGVSISGYAASVVDSTLFLRLAFHTFHGWWQFSLAKIAFVVLASPIAWLLRRQFALLPGNPSPSLAS